MNNNKFIFLLVITFTFTANILNAKIITNNTPKRVGVRIYYTQMKKTPSGIAKRKHIPATQVFIIEPYQDQEIEIPKYKFGYDRIIAGATAPIYKKLTNDLFQRDQVFIAPFGKLAPKHYSIAEERGKYRFEA